MEKVAKIIFFLWVSEVYIRQFLGANFDAFPSFTAMGICCWEWLEFRKQEENRDLLLGVVRF